MEQDAVEQMVVTYAFKANVQVLKNNDRMMVELLEAIRYSGQGLAQGVCKQAHQAKRERVEHVPFLLDQAACGLN